MLKKLRKLAYGIVIVHVLLHLSCKVSVKKECHNADILYNDTHNVTAADSLEIFPLVLSFYSRGSGIDYVAYKAILMTINEHNAINRTRLVFNTASWGREGEKDLCFPRQNTINFDSFVSQVRSTLDSNKNVHVLINHPCNNLK